MADNKGGSGGEPMTDRKATEQIIGLLAGLLLLGAVATALFNFFDSLIMGDPNAFFDRWINYFLEHIWPIWKSVAMLVSIGATVGIAYNLHKIGAINQADRLIYYPPVDPRAASVPVALESETRPKDNKRWEKVLALTNSQNQSDWKLAIIEADIMLDELLHGLGYVGETVGEMLKSASKNDFVTLDEAWEAHKVRNDIAHSGGTFEINERETKRVIALFEKVFREFGVI